MRKLVFFCLGFAAACALCAYLLPISACRMAIMISVVLSILLTVISKGSKHLKQTAIFFLGCAIGFFWFRQYDIRYLSQAKALDGTQQQAVIRLSDYSEESDYGRVCEGTVALQDKTYQIRVYLDSGEGLEPGWELDGQFLFRLTTPGGQRESAYYQGEGMFLLAYQRGELTVRKLPETWQDFPARLRRNIKTTLEETFPQDTYAFAKALLIGDTSDLSYKTDTDFKISGIRHVIAVSGLHVSILFALVSMLALKNRFLTVILGYPTLLIFAAVAGFTPSVIRACLMMGLMLLGLLCSREYDGCTSLAFAVLVMLLGNPMAVVSVSLQLSAGSVAGIFLFQPALSKWMLSFFGDLNSSGWRKRTANWLVSSVCVTLAAQVFTLPLSALYFGTVSLVGILTNLLTLWVISAIFYGILAVCLLSAVFLEAAGFLAAVVSVPIRYVLKTAQSMGSFPLAAVYTESEYLAAWVIFLCLLIAVFIFQENKKPKILTCCAVISLCISLLASWTEPIKSDLRFTVLDVGQGQCLIFQSEGKTYMVDCGGDSDRTAADLAVQTLFSQGIFRLDGLILTHMDRDHAGAAENLLSRMPTELLVLPPEAEPLSGKVKQTVWAREDLQLRFGGTNIQIYAPTFPGNSNEMSLCILFDTKKCDILITGDRNGFGERSLLRHAEIPKVDILVAGHHGSKHSTCEELLEAVRPDTVCISVSETNSYGHPAPELLQRLEAFGCTVYRTDKHGTILIRRGIHGEETQPRQWPAGTEAGSEK